MSGWDTASAKEKTEIARNVIDIAIKGVAATFVILCLAVPGFLIGVSRWTGFDLAALYKGELKPYVEKIEQLQQQLADTTAVAKAVEQSGRVTTSSAPPAAGGSIISGGTPAGVPSIGALRQMIERNESTLAEAAAVARDAPVTSTPGTPWGVVAGGDRTEAQARDELDWLRANGFQPTLFLRDGWYRSVAIFAGRDAAYAALPKIRQHNGSAYPVEVARWCPGPTVRPTMTECARGPRGGDG